MDFHLKISSGRQKRALEILLSTPSINVRELGRLIGALNPSQVILELRRQGFGDIIHTRRCVVHDRDGKLCHPGEYYMPEEFKEKVALVLNKNTSREAQTSQEESTLINDTNHNQKEDV